MLEKTVKEDIPAEARALLEGRISPVTRLLIATIALLLGSTFAWMGWAEMDEVVNATGKVEPAGRVKLINHPEGGRIAQIHVEEGQMVAQGDLLVSFDPELDSAERRELLGRWQVATAEAARLEAESSDQPIVFPTALWEERRDIVDRETELFEARAESRLSERDAMVRLVEARNNELRTASAEVSRLRTGSDLLRQQFEAVRELAEQGLYPRLKLVEMERELADMRGQLAKAEATIGTARASLAESKSRLKGFDKRWRREVLDEFADVSAERDQLRQRLDTKETIMGDLEVRAPVGGTVQELVVTAEGLSVSAMAPILKLVPHGEGLVIKARLANDDIGRVHPGMPARVKVRAFDFARFGIIEGKVEQIAADASAVDQDQPPSYGVTVLTDADHVGSSVDNAVVPGMVVDVELKVGERTVLSYLTDSITTLKDQAFRDG